MQDQSETGQERPCRQAPCGRSLRLTRKKPGRNDRPKGLGLGCRFSTGTYSLCRLKTGTTRRSRRESPLPAAVDGGLGADDERQGEALLVLVLAPLVAVAGLANRVGPQEEDLGDAFAG